MNNNSKSLSEWIIMPDSMLEDESVHELITLTGIELEI